MAYTAPQIGVILLKADRTMYKIGQIAYENMFAEDNEALDYERDVIFIYKKAVEFADDFFVGTEKLDKVVERLATKISAYDYGELNPIYADAATVNIPSVVAGAALNDLTDVTIANLLDNQFLRYNAATGQWINVGPGSAVRSSQAFIATAGQTVFTTSAPFDAGLFDLYVNGVKLNSLSYTTFGEYQITLNDPCAAGDIVDVVIYDPNTGINPTANTLNDLTDVNIGPLANKQGLYYNSASGLWENGLVFVPYTGAVSSVNLGSYGITSSFYQANTAAIEADAVGKLIWDDTECTFKFMMKGGNVIQRIGQDLPVPVKHADNTGLSKGSVVYTVGSDGANKTVRYAIATGDSTSSKTFGVIAETVSGGAKALCTTYGYVRNVNTIGLTEGAAIWLSPTVSGGMTSTKPSAPNHLVYIGVCIKSHATEGIVFVNIQNGYELEELHNVDALNPNNNDGIFYNSTTSLWEHKQISTALGYTPANAATTLTINGVTYDLSTSRTWSVGSVTGSGASGQVAYWTGSSAVGGSSIFTWDNTNRTLNFLGADITQILNQTNTTLASAIIFRENSVTKGYIQYIGSAFSVADRRQILEIRGNNGLSFWTSAENARLHTTGNFALGNPTTDSGQRLQVSGDTLLKGSGNTSATTALTVQNSDGTNMWRFLNNGQLLLGSNANAPQLMPTTSGSSVDLNGQGIRFQAPGVINNAAAGNYYFTGDTMNVTSGFYNLLNIERPFSPTSGNAQFRLLQITSTINQTGGANGITRGLYVNPTLTSAADWRSIEWSNNSGWGLYGAGTATNYLAGRFMVGTSPFPVYTIAASRDLDYGSGVANIAATGRFMSNVTVVGYGFTTYLSTQATSFTLPLLIHYDAQLNLIGNTSSVSSQMGFRASSSLIGATNNYGFFGDIASGTGRWNLYMNGTAANYMNGELLLGSTTNSGEKLQVTGTMKVTGASTFSSTITATGNITSSDGTSSVIVQTTSNAPRIVLIDGRIGGKRIDLGPYPTGTTGNFSIHDSTANATRLIIDESGNLGIGITPTVRLHVSGDTILRGSGATSATTALTVQNSASTNLFTVRNDGAVSIGAASYNDGLRINRNPILANASSIFVNTAIQTTVNTIYRGIATSVGLFGSGFTLPNLSHFECINDGSFTAGVVTNLYGFRENLGTYVATNVYGFYGAIPAASGRWNLYMNGTADNYLAGDLGIGTTSVTNWLNIGASTTAKAHINLASGVAPTSPANGDIWFDGTDIKMRIGGVTKTFTLI